MLLLSKLGRVSLEVRDAQAGIRLQLGEAVRVELKVIGPLVGGSGKVVELLGAVLNFLLRGFYLGF